jgi:hypothetical protein
MRGRTPGVVDHSGSIGPSCVSFGGAVLYPFSFQSFRGQNVAVS